ncbi:MAG: hypothetical protein IPI49_14755 [Myxococcales bacterium]|nr:hypothetical protein [Myxococcales bacterium]
MRIDILERLARQLRETIVGVSEDLELTADEAGVLELVDLVSGSSGLVFEQTLPASTNLAPLEVVFDGMIARSSGRHPPRILTEHGLRHIDDLLETCQDIGRHGTPVRIQMASGEYPPFYSWPSEVWTDGRPAPLYALPTLPLVLDSVTLRGAFPPELPPITDTEAGKWVIRFTGHVERLDNRKSEMRIRRDNKLKELNLSEEQFATVDGEDARWKRVLVTALSATPNWDGVVEVLRVVPATEDVEVEATPTNEAAQQIQPLLKRIADFADLPARWDSYSAEPIKIGAINAAKAFLVLAASELRARNMVMTLPFAAPVSRGSVQLEWENGDKYLEIELFGERWLDYMRSVDNDAAEGETNRDKALDLVVWFHQRGER